MPQFTVKIAADPKQVADLKRFIEEHAEEVTVPVATKSQALDRDASILELVLTAVTTQAIELMFSLIKDYVTEQFKKPEKPMFAVQIENAHLHIKDDEDVAKLDDLKPYEIKD
jgi:hypothetical protein